MDLLGPLDRDYQAILVRPKTQKIMLNNAIKKTIKELYDIKIQYKM